MHLFDLAVALIFLFSLIAVSRFRRYLSGEDKESYNHVVCGLMILAAMSLAQVYSNMGLFSRTPFISDPLFFRLIFWIGIITGLSFLISGVTTWVPLSRSYRKYNKNKIERLEFIKKVEQLVRVEHRLPVVFEKTLQYMATGYPLGRGAAYLYSTSRRGTVCVDVFDREGADTEPLREVVFDSRTIGQIARGQNISSTTLVDTLPKNTGKPDLIVPVSTGSRVAGLFLLWAKPSAPLSDEDRMNLKIGGDIIAHEVQCQMMRLKHEFLGDLDQWCDDLQSRIDYRGDVRESATAIVDHLRKKIDVDLFSLTLVSDYTHAQRITIGENGGILAETNVDMGRVPSIGDFVYQQGDPIYVDDLKNEPSLAVDEIIARNGYSSLAVVPIRHGVDVEGVLTIATRAPYKFGGRRKKVIEAILPIAGGIAAAERHRLELGQKERRGYVLNRFLRNVMDSESGRDVCARAASLISAELKPSAVRVSTADSEGTFLESRALETTRPLGMVAPAQGSMILSLMPYHELVLDTGRPMMINQESTDRKMTEAEERQVFGVSISSSLLVPIKVGPATVGVVSLAETRSWSRYQFRQGDIQFVTAVAAVIAVAIQLGRRQSKPDALAARIQAAKGQASDETQARSRIKSSLSGILGSLELLKSNEKPTEENLDRCLSIIDKSARKISEYVSVEIPQQTR